MKPLSEQIFPVENYTDKIHVGVKAQMKRFAHLAFTISQLRPYVQSGYPWLKTLDERQTSLLDQIMKTGLAKLVQQGLVKKVSSKVSVEKQWQWAANVADSGYTNVTSEDSVASTPEALKKSSRRAVGAMSLWRLNGKGLFGQLHKA
jgi:hypothetical protein